MALQGTSECTNLDKGLRTEESRRLWVATSTLTHHRKYRAPSFSRTNPAQRKKKTEAKLVGSTAELSHLQDDRLTWQVKPELTHGSEISQLLQW